MGNSKSFWGVPRYVRKIEDIEFQTECGQKWKLVFEKTEYRAYVYMHGGWKPMHLGSGNPKPLQDYIMDTYREGVKK